MKKERDGTISQVYTVDVVPEPVILEGDELLKVLVEQGNAGLMVHEVSDYNR